MRRIALAAICLAGLVGPAETARADDDWGAKRDPFDAAVVRRYQQTLARDPHDARALPSLLQLYGRYRSVAKLEAEYRTKLEKSVGAEAWAPLVVLARMPRPVRADTIALWQRALKIRPDDARSWIAYGDLVADRSVARDAFQTAAKHATTPAQKKLALTKLLRTVTGASAAEADITDAAHAELIAMAPRDGKLWLDRGGAQLAANRHGDAAKSFATAESLLALDPEMRLNAMMNQGVALERMGRADEAIAQYEKTLARMPRGYYLREEVVPRIVGVERARKRLPDAIARLETSWPERSRGHFEWSTLALLYGEIGDDEKSLVAYRRAVAIAPTEVTTQRALIAVLDKVRPDEALAQHEKAARLAPGDANLQLELAKRYHPTQPKKALATLDRLARRMSQHVSVRKGIAELYVQWDETKLAIREYEAIANIEPHEIDHAVVLGDAYWADVQPHKAQVSWARLEKIGTAQAHMRHGEILAMHELYLEAIGAFTKSILRDPSNTDAWRERAKAHDELAHHEAAIDDARKAVALRGLASREDGQRERHLLVRALGRRHAAKGDDATADADDDTDRDDDADRGVAKPYGAGPVRTDCAPPPQGRKAPPRGDECIVIDDATLRGVVSNPDHPRYKLAKTVLQWRFAFEHGDANAGYLLAAHHARIGSPQQHDILVELYRRVPSDDSLGIAVARSYRARKEWVRARHLLEGIAARSPQRAEEVAKLVDQIDTEQHRAEQEARWEEQKLSEEERRKRRTTGVDPGIVGEERRFGFRVGLGADVRETSSAILGFGVYRMHGITDSTAISSRFEWVQRDDEMEEVNAFALGVGITQRILDARKFEVALGIGPRFELRYGSDAKQSSWGRGALNADATLEVIPRAIPATLGVRFHQSLLDASAGSAVVFELGFELR